MIVEKELWHNSRGGNYIELFRFNVMLFIIIFYVVFHSWTYFNSVNDRYGISGADTVVRNLRCIWISHIHADHHAGLARILALRRDLLKGVEHESILVIGPEKVGEFLKEYIKLEDLDMLFLDCWSTTRSKWDNTEAEDKSSQPCLKKLKPSTPLDDITLLKRLRKVLGEAGLMRLISFPVVHCDDAFGVVLESADRMNHGEVVPGWKVVYSGDTRPCSEVIDASLGATILIHEVSATAPRVKIFVIWQAV